MAENTDTLVFEGFKFHHPQENRPQVRARPHHRVLVIEDEEESSLLFEVALKAIERRIDIRRIKSAEEAEKILKNDQSYDLIIADHFLEGQETGLDLWKTCREKYRKIPFLMTSSLDARVFSVMVDDEMDRPLFLHKPFRVDQCKKIVEWFWEGEPLFIDEEPPRSNIVKSNFIMYFGYRAISLVALGMLVIFTSSKHEFSHKNLSQGAISLPMSVHLIVPTFEPKKDVQKAVKRYWLQDAALKDLRSQVWKIQMRADDIFESLGPMEDALKIILPNAQGRHLQNFERFEQYGKSLRVA